MKNFIEKLTNSLPYFILLLLLSILLIFFISKTPDFQQFILILQTLIWPVVVLIGLLFFKKVFTYLLFSLEEFNFFGNKGKLKDVRELIEEKVEKIIEEEKSQRKRLEDEENFKKEFAKAKESRVGFEKKAKDNLELAMDIFKKYQELTKSNSELTKELNMLRKLQTEREMRRERIKKIIERRKQNEKVGEHYPETASAQKANKFNE